LTELTPASIVSGRYIVQPIGDECPKRADQAVPDIANSLGDFGERLETVFLLGVAKVANNGEDSSSYS
jgi:hypothetical protein